MRMGEVKPSGAPVSRNGSKLAHENDNKPIMKKGNPERIHAVPASLHHN